ncbi:MAG: hypothetical protein ACYDD1_08430 [Caulobacteraceae bacterium]
MVDVVRGRNPHYALRVFIHRTPLFAFRLCPGYTYAAVKNGRADWIATGVFATMVKVELRENTVSLKQVKTQSAAAVVTHLAAAMPCLENSLRLGLKGEQRGYDDLAAGIHNILN